MSNIQADQSEFAASRRRFALLGVMTMLAWLLPRPARAVPIRRPRTRSVLDVVEARMGLIRRRQWDGSRPRFGRLTPASAYYRITVHHSGTDSITCTAPRSVAHAIGSIVSAHRGRRYGDIAYHFVVDYGGRVWEGRSLAYQGAHVLSANRGNIGILLLGNFERQDPSPAQLAAMRKLVDILRLCCSISRSQIYGHRDLSSSVCPGRRLYPYVAALRRPA